MLSRLVCGATTVVTFHPGFGFNSDKSSCDGKINLIFVLSLDNNFNPSDIDECREANACGANTLCNNSPGNYTCACQEGYAGDPYTGVSSDH